ncbi:hypothetical protein J6590_052164 [Homalodisca vitripennis]|nr:hypothetical protein J6590_052164 [Homalodisca vitripennis]
MWEDTDRSRGVVIQMWMTQNVLFLVIVSDLEVIHHYTECPPPGHRVRPRGDPSLHWSVGVVSLHLFHHILIRITVGYIVTNPVPQECGRTLTAVVVLLFKCG